MLFHALDGEAFAPEHPDLAGRRVVITGIASRTGIEIAKAFAGARTRLLVHAADGARASGLEAALAGQALELKVATGPLADPDAILAFARTAARVWGGLDAVINIADAGCLADGIGDGPQGLEEAMAELLALPCLVTRIAANRMRMVMNEGSIINVIAGERMAALIQAIARAKLAALTRTEAQSLAGSGIRINAIVPCEARDEQTLGAASIADVATLALHLASPAGHQLSGLTFEAYAAGA